LPKGVFDRLPMCVCWSSLGGSLSKKWTVGINIRTEDSLFVSLLEYLFLGTANITDGSFVAFLSIKHFRVMIDSAISQYIMCVCVCVCVCVSMSIWT
jgi:hypothetical protein